MIIGSFKAGAGYFSCTFSAGVVEMHEDSDSLMMASQADEALYRAKENGRNQVCFYDELIASGQLKTKVANDDVELF